MRILKIEDNKGHFLGSDDEFIEIDKISKDDLFRLSKHVLTTDVELDPYDKESLPNQAHQIIYKSIFEKLIHLYERKQEFIDESERAFLSEYERYNPDPVDDSEAEN